MVQESTVASQLLSEEAKDLATLIGRFKIDASARAMRSSVYDAEPERSRRRA
jgi:hypothetical protein